MASKSSSYLAVVVARSDGMRTYTSKSTGVEVPNEPTKDQQNKTPREDGYHDYYRKVSPEDTKHADWRRKLAHWMVSGYDQKNEYKGKPFILADFPDGFELWEHFRYHPNNATGEKKGKVKGKHAAKEYDRADAYLYGHKGGRQKRYRSPAEFLPHLLWLSRADPAGDCFCKNCMPGSVDVQEDTIKVEAKEKKHIPAVAPVQKSTPAQVAPPASAARIPAAIPNAVTAEQQLDSMANSLYLYRPGELVWYNKNTGTWGLAIITMRQVKDNKARYLVQPLSHPYYHPNAQVKTQDDDLRPWLAWSVPALGNAKYQNSTYDQVPWNEILASYPADPIVDGSILAAKAIDSSYSFFEPDASILTGPGEKAYKGMYVGAEKIWVGEPVRLRGPGNDPVVLVIKKIIERTVSAITSSVAIIGDVYTLVQMPAPLQSRQVPQRMSKDLDFRNDVEGASQKGLWNEWRISEPSATKRLEDIKGRWYETRNLLPVLRGVAQFQADVAKGITGDAGLWMNGRGDFTTGNIKKRDRESTLGPSVPQGTKVSRGLDDPAGDRFPDLMEVDNGYMALH